MVKTRHAPLTEFHFQDPSGRQSGVEVVEFAELSRRLTPAVYSRPHRVSFHQLMLVTSGSGALRVDFEEYRCHPGMLVHVAPGQVQRLPYAADRSPAPITAQMILFTATSVPRLELIVRLIDPPAGQPVWTVPQGELAYLQGTWAELACECRRALDDHCATRELIRLLLGAVLLRIARLPGAEHDATTARGRAFRSFQLELERSFTETRNASDYATRLGYAPRSLNRLCQEATGHTAKQLIDARVTLEAKRLLVHTDEPASAIAHHLGFREPTQFAKFFMRGAGRSPGAYRNASRD